MKVFPVCADCAHYVRNAKMIGHGTCVALPPTPVAVIGVGGSTQGFTNIRPVVRDDDACSLFLSTAATLAKEEEVS